MSFSRTLKIGFAVSIALFAMLLSNASGQTNATNPAIVRGTVSLGSEPLKVAYLSTTNSRTSTTSGAYSMTVDGTPLPTDIRVSSYAFFNEYNDYVNFGPQNVTVAEFLTSVLDLGHPDPGHITATVQIEGGSADSGVIRFKKLGLPYTYTQHKMGSGSTLVGVAPVVPNNDITASGFVYFEDQKYVLPTQRVSVKAGGTASVNWVINYNPPDKESITGTISSYGTKVPGKLEVRAFNSRARYARLSRVNSGSYSIPEVNAGISQMSAKSYFNDNQTYLRYPLSAFSPSAAPDVPVGGISNVDISYDQALITGKFSIEGTKALSEASFLQFKVQGVNSTASSGGLGFTSVNPATGHYEFVAGPGSWMPRTWSTRWFQNDPLDYIDSSLNVTDDEAQRNPISLIAGQTVTQDRAYKTGTVTLTHAMAGGDVLSRPSASGRCEKFDESGQRLYRYNFTANHNSQEDVTEGSVTVVGLEGLCEVTFRAYVGGARVNLSPAPLVVAVIPGVAVVKDTSGLSLSVE